MKIEAALTYFNLNDGTPIYYQKYMPESPRAIIIFLHGFGDHVARYGSFTRYFVTRGYGVCLFDYRGHGRSGGRRTHVNKFYDYLYDISQFIEFIKSNSPDAPILLAGHGFGGQLAINFVVKYSKGVRGVILSAPSFGVKMEVPKWKLKLGTFAAKWLPIYRVPTNIDPAKLSDDPKIAEEYAKDPYIVRDISVRCGYEIYKNMELLMAMASRIHLPILLLHGSADRMTDPEATKRFFMRLPAINKKLKVYQGGGHEIFNDRDKNEAFQDISTWLEEQLNVEFKLAGAYGRRGV